MRVGDIYVYVGPNPKVNGKVCKVENIENFDTTILISIKKYNGHTGNGILKTANGFWTSREEVVPLEIYNSPLYKAMSEE